MTPEQLVQERAKYGIPPQGFGSVQSQNTASQRISELQAAWAPKPPDTTMANKATFPASGTESPLGMVGHTIGNIPSSAINFGKSVFDFFNPLNTAKTAQGIGESIAGAEKEGTSGPKLAVDTVKGLPKAAYDVVVPQFLKHIFSGDLKSAAATIENDPVGQIAPLIMLARGVAIKAGKGAEFDNAISTISKPVTATGEAIKSGAGALTTQTLGAGTGAGASSVKEAYISAQEGGPALESLTKAMRGETTPEDIIKSTEDVVRNIKETRGVTYRAQLEKLGEDKVSHDITPIITELNKQLQNFGITKKNDGTLDFSRSKIGNSGEARRAIQGAVDELKDWGTQTGDRTGIGLDTLKQKLGDFYADSSQARALITAVKSKVSDILNKEVKGYREMTGGYTKASNFLEEIKSATGVGSNAKPDTVFTKLTTAMKGDKQFRLEVLREMEKVDPTLMNKIAGSNLSEFIPRGLVGRGTDVLGLLSILTHGLNPQLIPIFLGTSPRIVGEFMRSAGMASNKVTQITDALSKLGAPLSKISPAIPAQENQQQIRQKQSAK